MGLILKYRCIKMEEEQKIDKKAVLKKIKYPAIILGVLGAILLVFSVISIQPLVSLPSPEETYNFIINNYNPNIINASLQPQIITVNSTIPIKNYTTVVFNNGTYLYYFGAEFCPFCASLSYVTYSALHNNTLPPYSNDFYIAEGNIPAIPINEIQQNAQLSGVDGMYFYENPMNTTELQDMPQYEIANLTQNWIASLPTQAQFLFGLGAYRYPNLFIVKTSGNTTKICNAYSGIQLYQYNQTNAPQLSKYFNTKGLSLNAVIPDTNDMENIHSLIENCITELNSNQSV